MPRSAHLPCGRVIAKRVFGSRHRIRKMYCLWKMLEFLSEKSVGFKRLNLRVLTAANGSRLEDPRAEISVAEYSRLIFGGFRGILLKNGERGKRYAGIRSQSERGFS